MNLVQHAWQYDRTGCLLVNVISVVFIVFGFLPSYHIMLLPVGLIVQGVYWFATNNHRRTLLRKDAEIVAFGEHIRQTKRHNINPVTEKDLRNWREYVR